MSQVTEQSVRFQTALASIKLIQASAVLDLTEDDFDFLTSNKVLIATDRPRRHAARLGQDAALDPFLAAVGGVGAGLFPPRAGPCPSPRPWPATTSRCPRSSRTPGGPPARTSGTRPGGPTPGSGRGPSS